MAEEEQLSRLEEGFVGEGEGDSELPWTSFLQGLVPKALQPPVGRRHPLQHFTYQNNDTLVLIHFPSASSWCWRSIDWFESSEHVYSLSRKTYGSYNLLLLIVSVETEPEWCTRGQLLANRPDSLAWARPVFNPAPLVRLWSCCTIHIICLCVFKIELQLLWAEVSHRGRKKNQGPNFSARL